MEVDMQVVSVLSIAGRWLLAVMLAVGGVKQSRNVASMRQYAASRGVPFPGLLVPVSTVLLLATSAMLVLGILVDIAALATLLFYIPTVYYMHPYWKFQNEARPTQVLNFARNLSLAGGSVLCAVAFIALGEVPLGLTDTLFHLR